MSSQRPLRELLQDVIDRIDPAYRQRAADDLASLLGAGVDTYDDLLAAASRAERDVQLRSTACWFVGRLGDPSGLPVLLDCLQAADPALRSEAARSLGALCDNRAMPALLAAMREDTDASVRMYAICALGLMCDDEAIEPIVQRLQDAREAPKVRGMAAETLAAFHDARAIEPLVAALSDPEVDVRFWAAFALGELGAEQALPALRHLAAHDDEVLPGWWSVKREAESAIHLIEKAV